MYIVYIYNFYILFILYIILKNEYILFNRILKSKFINFKFVKYLLKIVNKI